jgi:hypothetical protein
VLLSTGPNELHACFTDPALLLLLNWRQLRH